MRTEDLIKMEREYVDYLSKDYYEVKVTDNINNPSHYNHKGIECIDAIEAVLTPEEFRGYLKGNITKYWWRHPYKGKPKQDLDKMQWYMKKYLTKLPDVV